MDKAQRLRALSRIPLSAAALAALFWGVWRLVAGSVPAVTSLRLTPSWTAELPFAVSRWWDVPSAAALAFLITFALTSRRAREDDETRVGLVVGLGYGLVVGWGYGLGFGLAWAARGALSPSLWRAVGRWLSGR